MFRLMNKIILNSYITITLTIIASNPEPSPAIHPYYNKLNHKKNIIKMRSTKKTKFQVMSQCLKHLKQLPQNLQMYTKNNNTQLLLTIIQCSNKFIILANDSQQHYQYEITLFHRFFCRVKQNVIGLLTYYLHTNSYIFIRELLCEINNQIMQYRPGINNYHILLKISEIILKTVQQILITKNIKSDKIQQIMKNCVTFVPKSYEEQHVMYYKSANLSNSNYSNSINYNNKNRDNDSTQIQTTLRNLFGLDTIVDIDYNYLQNIRNIHAKANNNESNTNNNSITNTDTNTITNTNTNTTNNMQSLQKQVLNRNRFIYQIMKKYKQKYTIYQNKAQNKKNRQSNDYKPTIFEPNKYKLTLNLTNTKSNSSPRPHPNISKRHNSHSNHKYTNANPFQHKLTSIQHNIQQFSPTIDDEKLKQQILNQIYAFRQKLCVKKIMIGINQLQNKQDQLNQEIKKFNRTYKTFSANKNQRNRSQSSRIKVVKNFNNFNSNGIAIGNLKISGSQGKRGHMLGIVSNKIGYNKEI